MRKLTTLFRRFTRQSKLHYNIPEVIACHREGLISMDDAKRYVKRQFEEDNE